MLSLIHPSRPRSVIVPVYNAGKWSHNEQATIIAEPGPSWDYPRTIKSHTVGAWVPVRLANGREYRAMPSELAVLNADPFFLRYPR